ncbi:helix-turn-helix transcriptional regulator [Myxococcus sp. MISCRS1]|jgi:transcriptional regulator with XRE-family HTH domain|uniref:helix-turn-helix domain-containing protein n=1 Tax=Myxococcus TaxID=32 RepID=UPI0011438DAC|nr:MULTISPECIES: helix-turn-helix transcriptional regulator [Myxococcus]BDT38400.1 helix-turn-helix domain-containing protein [Myxococcus sp. MH1]MBZ4398385.1 helix-turn-helix domain-containing protein [Myxococcus sp. AS-1-15]MBZ4412714.1 helix-turn-helix domain-containing protein [Myxococcus sp. XM-1-1-1]MCK8502117.1 helix-turn-helix domain-containing protein [Myxococcus fulvus]MCY1000050.1 helix-turn-helix transcriptional regulator [Myxococcus sp. MISCRS1]
MEKAKNKVANWTRFHRKFGSHVRQLRNGRELTQEVLAERCDLSVDAIRRIERGSFSPSLDTLGKLSVGLDVSLKTLFQGFEHERTGDVAEICDFLSCRSDPEVKLARRVLQAMFEDS